MIIYSVRSHHYSLHSLVGLALKPLLLWLRNYFTYSVQMSRTQESHYGNFLPHAFSISACIYLCQDFEILHILQCQHTVCLCQQKPQMHPPKQAASCNSSTVVLEVRRDWREQNHFVSYTVVTSCRCYSVVLFCALPKTPLYVIKWQVDMYCK